MVTQNGELKMYIDFRDGFDGWVDGSGTQYKGLQKTIGTYLFNGIAKENWPCIFFYFFTYIEGEQFNFTFAALLTSMECWLVHGLSAALLDLYFNMIYSQTFKHIKHSL